MKRPPVNWLRKKLKKGMPEPGMCDHVLHLALGFDGGHAALNALEQLVDDTGLNPRHACTRAGVRASG